MTGSGLAAERQEVGRPGRKRKQHRGLGLICSSVQVVQGRMGRGEEGDTAAWVSWEGVRDARFLSPCPQDVDEVFQSKMDLEGRLESLREYVCFLTRLYEEVRTCEEQGEVTEGTGWTGSLWPPGEPLGGEACWEDGFGLWSFVIYNHWCENSSRNNQAKPSKLLLQGGRQSTSLSTCKPHTLLGGDR